MPLLSSAKILSLVCTLLSSHIVSAECSIVSERQQKETIQNSLLSIEKKFKNKKWQDVQKLSNQFLLKHRRSTHRAKVRFLLAEAYYFDNKKELALKQYGVYVTGYSFRVPKLNHSVVRIMNICWEDGRKQEALQAGSDFIMITRKLVEQNKSKMDKSELKYWDIINKWVKGKTKPQKK